MLQVYGDPGVPLVVHGEPDDVRIPFERHRTRVREVLRGFDDAAWDARTRCGEWRVLDLVNHLSTGARFWGYTLSEAKKGNATRALEGFDPRTSPRDMTDGMATLTPAQAFAVLCDADDALLATVSAFDTDSWSATAEGPAGHIAARLALNHALFDSWVHERDLLLPLGVEPVVEVDELLATLRYLLGLAALASGRWDAGASLVVAVDGLDATIEVAVALPVEVRVTTTTGDRGLRVDGPALADAMSGRGDLTAVVRDAEPDQLAVLAALEPFLS